MSKEHPLGCPWVNVRCPSVPAQGQECSKCRLRVREQGGGRRGGGVEGRTVTVKHRAPALQSKGEHQGRGADEEPRGRTLRGNLVTVANQPGSGTNLAGTQKTVWGQGRVRGEALGLREGFSL